MIRVLIADDHPIIRYGLQQILSREPGFVVAGQASNAAEALELFHRESFDVVLLDITMPGRSGLEALRDIKQQNPRLPVLILSIHPEDQYAVRALRAGADGYLTKASAAEELVKAIKQVLQGKRYVSEQLAQQLVDELRSKEAAPHERLSDREYEVFRMLAAGKTVSEIAEELSLSVKTVSSHRMHILEKTGLRNNAEIMRYAVDRRIE